MKQQIFPAAFALTTLFGAYSAQAQTQPPLAETQDISPVWLVKQDAPSMENFTLNSRDELSFVRVTKKLLDERQEVSLRIGQRNIRPDEQRQTFSLTEDMGEMGEAKLKFMKIEWRLRFGGPR